MHNDDDHLAFVEDTCEPESGVPGECWPLLIVDDDEDVHHATEFALQDLRVLERPLEFLHAFGAEEVIAALVRRPDVAIILLDVVMEREDAGLRVVERIRNELGMAAVRIVLRTGQPGYAPELEAISRYDINDYKTKSELTRSKLFTTVTSAIRSFEQIRRLEASRNGLELIMRGANHFNAEHGSAAFATGIITQMAALLGVTPAGVVCAHAEHAAPAAEEVHPQCFILATTGRFRKLVNQSPARIDDPQMRQTLEACVRERKSQRSERCLALYFPGRHGRSFAACIESNTAIPEIDRHLLDVFCTNIAICGENVGLVERLRHTAYVDGLTELPNRAAQIVAIDELGKIANAADYTLALIDIDQFSEAIDAFGYLFGDQQLKAIASRLRTALPDDVHVARVGGDVFGVYGSADRVNPENLRKILFDPFASEVGLQTISFSIGLVRSADAEASGTELLRNAAIALKRAKLDGPGNEAFYTAEVGVLTRKRVHLLHDLRAAFDNGRLFLAYQPQIDLASGRVVGAEALLRWRDEAGEFVPLEQFIPVAEHSGLIVSLGAWVLRTALVVQRELAEQGYPLRMAVNVSPIQFRHPEFVAMVEAAVAQAGIDPALLELEITESVALHGGVQIAERLHAIKALGVSIAIDDFGTGFSSLSYLDRIPADCLKIDRSFIHALDDRRSGTRIADLVIQLGKQLDMRVVAEGVESAGQLQTLVALGCGEGQGWYYARAMLPPDLLAWLAGRER